MSETPVTVPETGTRKPRLFYLDFIRALATLLIVLTHFNNPYLAEGGYLLTNMPFGIYVGGLGVSLFLTISGAALTFTYRRPYSLKTFWWKRAKGLYPMFWIAWIVAFVFLFTKSGGVSPVNAPAKNFIFTIFGIDGLLENFHVQTAYILGEWFLGFILIFYLVFPLLLWGVDEHPITTAILGITLYAGSHIYFLNFPGLATSVLLPTHIPELLFGMYFTKYVKHVHWAWLFPVAGILIVSSLYPTQIHEDIATTFVGIATFTALVILGRYIAFQPVRAFVSLISKYSYPIFLTHHVVIAYLYNHLAWMNFGMRGRIAMFVAVCLITFTASVILDWVTNHIVAWVTKAFKGAPWRPLLSPTEP
ncbi:MAG: acyltransferase family protein [Schaalia turicensis]